MIAGCIVALLLILLTLRIPVAFAIFLAGAVGLWWIGDLRIMWGTLQSTVFTVASYYEFIVIPMFILMAELVDPQRRRRRPLQGGRRPGSAACPAALAWRPPRRCRLRRDLGLEHRVARRCCPPVPCRPC